MGPGPDAPGVEGQQLGVHQEEGMAHLVPAALGAGVDVLHHLPLQELDALLAQLGVDQPLHGLWHGRERAEPPQTQPHSPRAGLGCSLPPCTPWLGGLPTKNPAPDAVTPRSITPCQPGGHPRAVTSRSQCSVPPQQSSGPPLAGGGRSPAGPAAGSRRAPAAPNPPAATCHGLRA